MTKLAAKAPSGDFLTAHVERRGFQRVAIDLNGRFMLEDRSEHPCTVIDISPGSVSFRTARQGVVGEHIIAYLEQIGRIEGSITRLLDDGFAMTIRATERKRDKLASQLTYLANRHELDLPDDRTHERSEPRQPLSTLHMDDGRQYPCRIVDLSLSGAAVEIDVKPEVGTPVTLGAMNGKVVRHFLEGVAIEFTTVQEQEAIDLAFRPHRL